MGRTWSKATRHLWPIEDDAETESDDGTDSPSQDNSPQYGIIMALASTSSAALTDDNTNCGHKFSSGNLCQDTESDSETESDSDDRRISSSTNEAAVSTLKTTLGSETNLKLRLNFAVDKLKAAKGLTQQKSGQVHRPAGSYSFTPMNEGLSGKTDQSRASSSHLETGELLYQPPSKYRRVADQKTIALPAEDALLAHQCASCTSLGRDFGSDLLEEMERVDLEALVSCGHINNFLGWIFL